MPNRQVIGLDLGSYDLKAIEMTQAGSGRYRVERAFCLRRPEEDSRLVETIQKALDEHRFHRGCPVVVSVSGKSVAVRYIKMPDIKPDQLKEAVKFEASKYLPFSEEEDIVLDCQKLLSVQNPSKTTPGTPEPKNEINVVLVGVKKSSINQLLDVLDALHLPPAVIDIDAFALGNLYEVQQSQLLKQDVQTKSIALVDVGASKTSVNILLGTESLFTREFYIAGNKFTETLAKKLVCDAQEAELKKQGLLKKEKESGTPPSPSDDARVLRESLTKPLEDLCQEINMSLDYFTSRFDTEVQEVWVSGGGAFLPHFLDEAHSFLLKPVKYWNPVEGFDVDPEAAAPELSTYEASKFAVAMGLAIRTE